MSDCKYASVHEVADGLVRIPEFMYRSSFPLGDKVASIRAEIMPLFEEGARRKAEGLAAIRRRLQRTLRAWPVCGVTGLPTVDLEIDKSPWMSDTEGNVLFRTYFICQPCHQSRILKAWAEVDEVLADANALPSREELFDTMVKAIDLIPKLDDPGKIVLEPKRPKFSTRQIPGGVEFVSEEIEYKSVPDHKIIAKVEVNGNDIGPLTKRYASIGVASLRPDAPPRRAGITFILRGRHEVTGAEITKSVEVSKQFITALEETGGVLRVQHLIEQSGIKFYQPERRGNIFLNVVGWDGDWEQVKADTLIDVRDWERRVHPLLVADGDAAIRALYPDMDWPRWDAAVAGHFPSELPRWPNRHPEEFREVLPELGFMVKDFGVVTMTENGAQVYQIEVTRLGRAGEATKGITVYVDKAMADLNEEGPSAEIGEEVVKALKAENMLEWNG